MTSRVSIISIWVCFILLLVLGIVMVASTGPCVAGQEKLAWYSTFLGKQCIFALLGLSAAMFLSYVDYHLWRRFVKLAWIICTILLICCYLPVIGMRINGEARWINLGLLTFQPSELAKITLMLTLANWYTTYREMAGTFWKGFVIPGAFLFGLPLLLILGEKDMGTAAALAMSGFCVMFVSGTRWWLLLLAMLLAAIVLYVMMTGSANRMLRIEAWQDPRAFSQGAGRQQWIAILAFARGGFTGVGLGNGIEKYGNLPYAHTDFIYAEIGEEWGFIGSAGVLILFTILTISGFALAVQTHDTFGRIFALGLSCTIFWPAMLNMMVVTAMLPNTGLPLPFISSGGTNLVFTIASIGLLTSIQRYTPTIPQNYWPTRRLKEIQNP
ncbi:MAG: cell division protein FtsW [Akkermansia sp.]|nr:cell division protein FtsW [Akkermansia sp.]